MAEPVTTAGDPFDVDIAELVDHALVDEPAPARHPLLPDDAPECCPHEVDDEGNSDAPVGHFRIREAPVLSGRTGRELFQRMR